MTNFKKGDNVEDSQLNVKGTVIETPDTDYATELNIKNPQSDRQSPFYGKIIVLTENDHEYYADPKNLKRI